MAPIHKNKTYLINITTLSDKGLGVGLLYNKLIYVKDALPGETLSVKIIKITKKYAVGKNLAFKTTASDRISPPCEIAHLCGGCQIQHQDYGHQIAYKQRLLTTLLKDKGVLSEAAIKTTLKPFIKAEPNFHYRNKAQFAVSEKNNSPLIGLYGTHSHDVIDTKTCPIQHPLINTVLGQCRLLLNDLNCPIYNEKEHSGILRHIVIRAGFKTNEIMVCFVVTQDNIDREYLISTLRKNPHIKGILLNINHQKTDTILGQENILVWGKDHIEDYIGAYKFKVSIDSFLQLNPSQCERLYALIEKKAGLKGHHHVIDAYCGVGTIGMSIAKHVKQVIGIESVKKAIILANENAVLNKIENISFIHGHTEKILPELINNNAEQSPHIIILDPPRKGCESSLLILLTQCLPEKIIYISCNPKTLIRDLEILTKKAYRINSIQGLDMFPHTTHIETLTVLEKIKHP